MVKVGMVSLGCSKNQVDGERLLALLGGREYQLCADPAQCQVVIINTCGFIEDAKQESIDTILEFAQEKGRGSLRCIVVTGRGDWPVQPPGGAGKGDPRSGRGAGHREKPRDCLRH